MEKLKLIFIGLFFILFISCEEEEIKTGTLSGTWKLIAYVDPETQSSIKEPSDIARSIVLTFQTQADSGSFTGHTVTNDVMGNFKILPDQSITTVSFGGTKVAEPEWGNLFWDSIFDSHAFEVNSRNLKIYYQSETAKYMLFTRQ